MKNIIIVSYLYNDRKIDGSIINAFEYFYTLYELKIPIELKIYGNNCNYLKSFFKEKYNICEKSLEKISNISIPEILKSKYNNVLLVCGYCTENLPKYFKYNAKNVLGISGYKCKTYNYVKYFNVFDFLSNGEVNYNQSFRLDLIKFNGKLNNAIFINSPHNPNVQYNSSKEILRREDLNTPNNIGKYNEMIYIQNPKIIDRKPRCFFECIYFGIKYDYIFNGIYDGSYYRFKDKNYIEMNENDKIIKEFLI